MVWGPDWDTPFRHGKIALSVKYLPCKQDDSGLMFRVHTKAIVEDCQCKMMPQMALKISTASKNKMINPHWTKSPLGKDQHLRRIRDPN